MRNTVAHAYRLYNHAEEYAMQDQVSAPQRVSWNKGKLTGAKPPLRSKHVWFDPDEAPDRRLSSVGGTSMPSFFAVLRFITSSNLVGCTTGSSEGFSPFKIRPT